MNAAEKPFQESAAQGLGGCASGTAYPRRELWGSPPVSGDEVGRKAK